MEKQETIFVGSGKIIETKIGQMTKLSFSKDDINKMVKYMKDNNLDWLNCNFSEKKNKTEGKSTHYVSIDTWKPENKVKENKSDGLPF
jgi:hypothetical protein